VADKTGWLAYLGGAYVESIPGENTIFINNIFSMPAKQIFKNLSMCTVIVHWLLI